MIIDRICILAAQHRGKEKSLSLTENILDLFFDYMEFDLDVLLRTEKGLCFGRKTMSPSAIEEKYRVQAKKEELRYDIAKTEAENIPDYWECKFDKLEKWKKGISENSGVNERDIDSALNLVAIPAIVITEKVKPVLRLVCIKEDKEKQE